MVVKVGGLVGVIVRIGFSLVMFGCCVEVFEKVFNLCLVDCGVCGYIFIKLGEELLFYV